jgi:hypothetical protein
LLPHAVVAKGFSRWATTSRIQSDLLDLPKLYAMFIGLSRFSFRAQILARPFVARSMIDADE